MIQGTGSEEAGWLLSISVMCQGIEDEYPSNVEKRTAYM